jgi:DNA-binding protein H-NS
MTDETPGTPHFEQGSSNFETMTAGEIMVIVAEALSHLNAENLTKVMQLTEEKRREREDETREVLLREFRERAAEAGTSLEALFPTGRSGRRKRSDAGSPLPVKYRGPEPGMEWSGRGREPTWLKQLENEGRHREEFRV